MAHDTQMLIRMDANLKQLVTDIARNEDRSVAWIVRKALHDFAVGRPEAARLQTALTDPDAPLPPTYKRPPGRPAKPDPDFLDARETGRIREYLDDPARERVTHDEVIAITYKLAPSDISAGHHARVDNIIRALGWIELVEVYGDGSEQVFWFKNDPRKSSNL